MLIAVLMLVRTVLVILNVCRTVKVLLFNIKYPTTLRVADERFDVSYETFYPCSTYTALNGR